MKKILRKAINPIRILINDSRCMGVILIACTFASLFISNFTDLGHAYRNILVADLPGLNSKFFPSNLTAWINNLLMAFFFLMAGMEIKRELLSGELSSVKKAVLPFGAALGGMIVPAVIYLIFNFNTSHAHGWGIPTATDIAFSVGIASLLGNRIPVGLKILLMALAIIDDLGAIIVIALFYGGHVNWLFLGLSVLIFGVLFACNYFRVRFNFIQVLLAFALWYTIYRSGVEASITGVIVAFITPTALLPRVEQAIHGYVNFLILPLFALVNTAILIPANIPAAIQSKISLGIIAGLVIGKPLGIFLFSRVLVALKVASLPSRVSWKQLFGMGTLAGIGFTMSIFTTMLAFKEDVFQDIAKISILISVAASVIFSMCYFMALNIKEHMEPVRSNQSSKIMEPEFMLKATSS